MSEDLNAICNQVRRDIVRMVHAQSSGHPGGSLGCVEYFVALYFEVMKHNTDFEMNGIDEDLFFLSNGHISPVLYSVLARRGYFDVKELSTFRTINSRLQGHPTTHDKLPGVRIASGSLGQGMSVAIGAALTKKLNNDSTIVYSLHGDGELQEGQIWEAAMFASHYKLDNLYAVVDQNHYCTLGNVDDIMNLEPLEDKWKSFGWETIYEKDGNNVTNMINNFKKLEKISGKPKCIIANTIKNNGIPSWEKEHNHLVSGKKLSNGLEEGRKLLK